MEIVRFLIQLTPLFCGESKCNLFDFKEDIFKCLNGKPSVMADVCNASIWGPSQEYHQ